MKTKRGLMMMRSVYLLVLLLSFYAEANAGLILSVDSNRTFTEDSGVQLIDIYIEGDDDSITFITTDIVISSGSMAARENGFFDAGAVKTGFIGDSRYLGSGKTHATSYFVYDPLAPDTAYLGLQFDPELQVPAIRSPIATLTVSVDGLSVGDYEVRFENFFTTAGVQLSAISGSFSVVTAVPEPSSVILMAATAGGLARWRHQRRKVSETRA